MARINRDDLRTFSPPRHNDLLEEYQEQLKSRKVRVRFRASRIVPVIADHVVEVPDDATTKEITKALQASLIHLPRMFWRVRSEDLYMSDFRPPTILGPIRTRGAKVRLTRRKDGRLGLCK